MFGRTPPAHGGPAIAGRERAILSRYLLVLMQGVGEEAMVGQVR
jgi:hypothetical protein